VRELMRTKGWGNPSQATSDFSWMTGGGLNLVGSPPRWGRLAPDRRVQVVICSSIEAPRMVKEERLEEQGTPSRLSLAREAELQRLKNFAGGAIGCDMAFPGSVIWPRISHGCAILTPPK
jgi:hypothetical protein